MIQKKPYNWIHSYKAADNRSVFMFITICCCWKKNLELKYFTNLVFLMEQQHISQNSQNSSNLSVNQN